MEGTELVMIYGKVTDLLKFFQLQLQCIWSGLADTRPAETHVGQRASNGHVSKSAVARSQQKSVLGT